jgi:hypothetical protein
VKLFGQPLTFRLGLCVDLVGFLKLQDLDVFDRGLQIDIGFMSLELLIDDRLLGNLKLAAIAGVMDPESNTTSSRFQKSAATTCMGILRSSKFSTFTRVWISAMKVSACRR